MKRIMFVCRKNSARSQMAEAWAKRLSQEQGKAVTVVSSGLEASEINPGAIAAMDAVGVDIRAQTSKALGDFAPEDFDVVISLCGCGVSLPEAWLTRDMFQDWQLEDPAENPQVFPQVRDEIKSRVVQLLAQLP